MQVKGKDVIGLNVITIDTGTILETVDDIAYNPNTQRVEALLVSSGGLFSSAKVIHIDDVRNIGEDAVVVHDAGAIKSVKDLDDTVHSIADSNKHLVKTNVMTIDGKELGKVTDIYFDSANGMVTSMEVSQGGLKTLSEGKKSIKPSDIVTIGADATIVNAYTEMKLEAQGEEGGLKGKLNDAKEKAADIAASTKETVQGATDKVVETSKDVAATVKDKSVELKDVAHDKASDASDVIQDKAAGAKELINDKAADAKVKADELKDDIQRKSEDAGEAADDALREARVKADELKESAQEKAVRAKDTVNDLATDTKERIDHVKDESARKVSSSNLENSEVVEQTTKKYEDADKSIKVDKIKVVKDK